MDARDWKRWVHEQGGCDFGESTVRITLIGVSPTTVVVETPIVKVSQTQLPPGEYIMHGVGGADLHPRSFNINLDYFGSASPIVELEDESGEPIRKPLCLSLGTNDVEQFLLTVHSKTPSFYAWTAKLPVLIDGTRRYVDIDDEGADFIFAGGETAACKQWDGRTWSPTMNGV